ncbi:MULTISPECIES: tRNA pseudouridine(55) synthase TruB [Paenibacillus]|uniref:tRNA pseudouridine(55) synthase TruB n=1 Tax=Paenibacillus TaxID=44249 RepID=UPI0002E91A73|nr:MULTISPECIES: tRNA pseudouridine(55) synthase TruB [Paenibacillus]KAF6580676.1 tRNA pseudouridine(55) synthase TruB [Paenibacillus sp. EKM211P]KKD53297.1 pseudouridine synthase [Paenibacillus sp. ICGEB2008]MBE3647267.1 tRNA pseudouridine(55) synthase TruB [Paenibacillus polymyxa]MBY7735699.1 tRNA pseudouridine(55) synthase TruB [Paenibacillus polymyxa]MCJ1219834.1 tRNA pseudouridine(55) synthase TruB [Paenibacillus polymyxa]
MNPIKKGQATWEGVLPVYKPAGFTSHDVVAKARRLLGMKRIGHTGTLDPQVTGVLPLCLGRATRVVEYMQERPKEYRATLRLGIATDTEDLTGTITEESERPVEVTEMEAKAVLERFVGTISQVPPMYSALKIDGKRLYELAREGKTVERKSREVSIYELEMTGFAKMGPHVDISFRALCSKGTYIRTLCVDIGRELGYPSTMVKLERTMSAGISAEHCLTFEEIERYVAEGSLGERLIATDKAIDYMPEHTVAEAKAAAALQGQRLSLSMITPPVTDNQPFRLYKEDKTFLGIYGRDESGAIAPIKVFLSL